MTGDSFFLQLPRLTADCFQIFLNGLAEAYPKSLNLVVLDNGRFHRAKSLFIPKNVVLIFLPPYSPELNPIERLWQDIKANLSLSAYESLETLAQLVSESLWAYSTETLQSLTSFSYFVAAANPL